MCFLQMKTRDLTTPRSSNPLSQIASDIGIASEIEVSQLSALRQHSCEALCPGRSNPIVSEIEVSQRCALRKHFCKTLCPRIADLIAREMEVSQCWALLQNSCKPLCILSSHFTARQLKRGDAAPDGQSLELPHDEL